jgi:hypothetical protein
MMIYAIVIIPVVVLGLAFVSYIAANLGAH